jgi:hypothetical protein
MTLMILTPTDIQERNRQYKELMMTKNKKANEPKTYQIETLDTKGDWQFRMCSNSEGYLDSAGRRWKDQNFCVDYRIGERPS